jgi:VanZ family protein
MLIVRVSAWALLLAIVFFSLSPPSIRPVTGIPHDLEHVAMFALTAFAFSSGYAGRWRYFLLLLVGLSAAIELAQLLIPGRHARVTDFAINVFGIAAGLTFSYMASSKTQN